MNISYAEITLFSVRCLCVCVVAVGLVVHPMITIILLHVSALIRPLHGIIHSNIHTRKAIVVLKYLITIVCS